VTQVVKFFGIVNPDDALTSRAPSWRDTIKVHPAANLFPQMNKAELAELGKDIRANGLISPIALWRASEDAQEQLLDGRNRLDGIEGELGRPVRIAPCTHRGHRGHIWCLETDGDDGRRILVDDLIGESAHFSPYFVNAPVVVLPLGVDPYAYVAAANIHRRHLTAEQKRDLIAKLIKATPEKSDRQIGETVKVDHKTVGAVRTTLEGRGEIPHVERKDTKGRSVKPRKPAKRKPATEGAAEQLRARVDKLQDANRQLEIKAEGLLSEIEELKAAKLAAATAASGNDDDEIARKLTRLDRLEIEVKQLRGERCALRSENKELKDETAKLKAENEVLRAQLAACSVQGADQ
jgi:hypothetical protein